MTTAHLDTFVRDALPAPEEQPEFLFTISELQYPDKLNAAAELIDTVDPARIAVANDAGNWTYGEMSGLSDRIARLLVEKEGLVPGNRVLLRGPNTAMMFAAWLGVLKAGGIVVSTMPILRPGEIVPILQRGRISHAIVDERFAEDFRTAAVKSEYTKSLVTYNGDAGGGGLERLVTETAPGFLPVATFSGDPALIGFTSGTTGDPKGCVHFHRDILAPADTFARHILKPNENDRWACTAPIAFTFGLGMLLIFPWRFGGTAVTSEVPGAKALVELIERFGVTILATAPTAYKSIAATVPENAIQSLRSCISAGEHLPEATWHAWHDATGLKLINGIGATEMMHIFISAAGDDIKPGSTGKAVPGYKAVILDEQNKPMTSGTGRLAVKGPVGCRYLADPRQANYVIKGWNVTGDTFRLDEDGYFWYVSRSDDMIISSGYNIAAPEVENALLTHEAVLECAVIGVPCPERGSKVKAFIVLKDTFQESAALQKDLQDYVKETIAPYKYPRVMEFVSNLPKTATGKLQRFALRPSPFAKIKGNINKSYDQ
jgi:2-aminobenzoate-CoA ligase|tara:strand:+ start:64836 stop:66476 length:1641 start_codon:yes stop_codon:yes gene_type:complete